MHGVLQSEVPWQRRSWAMTWMESKVLLDIMPDRTEESLLSL